MAKRKPGPISGKRVDGTGFTRIRRPVGFTLAEETISRLDEMSEVYLISKSRLIEILIAREYKAWKGGFNCLKDQLGI